MKPIHIRFGGYHAPTSVHHKAAEVLEQALAARLGDAVPFNFDGNAIASGHQAADLLTCSNNCAWPRIPSCARRMTNALYASKPSRR